MHKTKHSDVTHPFRKMDLKLQPSSQRNTISHHLVVILCFLTTNETTTGSVRSLPHAAITFATKASNNTLSAMNPVT